MTHDVKFHEENEFALKAQKYGYRWAEPPLVNFLIRSGIVKTEKQASALLLIVTLLAALIAAAVFHGGSNQIPDVIMTPDGTELTPQEYVELVGQRKDPFKERDHEM